jgi:hypothetical protein
MHHFVPFLNRPQPSFAASSNYYGLENHIRAAFGKKYPPSPHVKAAITPYARAAPGPATSPPRLLERLWNQAYNQAKTSDPSTVNAYEKILSAWLSKQDADASNPYTWQTSRRSRTRSHRTEVNGGCRCNSSFRIGCVEQRRRLGKAGDRRQHPGCYSSKRGCR